MKAANIDICKELYELSSWDDTDNNRYLGKGNEVPMYECGYLLRKLPESIESGLKDRKAWLSMDNLGSDGWQYCYRSGRAIPVCIVIADTPEDALCKLAIELFKQGILTKE